MVSRGTKHPEFPRLLTTDWGLYLPATSTDLLAILPVLEAPHSPWALKGLNSPGKIKSQHGTGSGSGEHSHGSQITGEFPDSSATVQQEGPVGADSSPATGIAVISPGAKQHLTEPWDQCHLWLS